VTATVDLVVAELATTSTPLIGFAGAPFTVASYLIEGAPTRTFGRIKGLMHQDPELFDSLMDRLVAITVAFYGPRWPAEPRRCNSSTHGPVRSRAPNTNASPCPRRRGCWPP
jgi:hypothetical protein